MGPKEVGPRRVWPQEWVVPILTKRMDSRVGSLLEFECVDNEVKEAIGFEIGGGNLEGFELVWTVQES